MKFIDSNVIAYTFYENPFRELSERALRDGGVTDTLALVEAFAVIESVTDRQRALGAIRGILRSGIRVVDVDVNILFELLKKISHYRLSVMDMMHYTVASLTDCESILSYDKDFNGLEIPREEP